MYKCILIDKKGFKKRVDMDYLPGRYSVAIRTRLPSVFAHESESYFEPAYNRIEFKLIDKRKEYYIFKEIE